MAGHPVHVLALATALSFGCATLPAMADQPPMAPTRPVSVTYRLNGGAAKGPEKIAVTYDQDAKRVRLEFYRFVGSPEPISTLIFDKPADRVTTLLDARKLYAQRDTAGLRNPGLFLDPDLTYTRIGEEKFAGLACTNWAVESPQQAGSACVTDDGVVLKATRGGAKPAEMDAIAIKYGAPPATAFDIPSDYTRAKTVPKP
ncbi:MAG: DUF4412 domain-containing protein [Acetobacteraceae bacterium]